MREIKNILNFILLFLIFFKKYATSHFCDCSTSFNFEFKIISNHLWRKKHFSQIQLFPQFTILLSILSPIFIVENVEYYDNVSMENKQLPILKQAKSGKICSQKIVVKMLQNVQTDVA